MKTVQIIAAVAFFVIVACILNRRHSPAQKAVTVTSQQSTEAKPTTANKADDGKAGVVTFKLKGIKATFAP